MPIYTHTRVINCGVHASSKLVNAVVMHAANVYNLFSAILYAYRGIKSMNFIFNFIGSSGRKLARN